MQLMSEKKREKKIEKCKSSLFIVYPRVAQKSKLSILCGYVNENSG